MTHTLKETIDLAMKNAILRAHPIGSYYLTEGTENPQDFIGGGWEKLTGRYVLQCSDDDHAAGTTVEAGLPDIAGNAGVTDNVCVNSNNSFIFGIADGCFSVSGSGARAHSPLIDAPIRADNRTITFRASKSNRIYGNSDTVQPPARIVNVWKRVS